MSATFEADDWRTYKMDFRNPHREIEPLEREISVVDKALATLVNAGVLSNAKYDKTKFLAHREAVKKNFEIPWTAITPRVQRLLYAINATAKPKVMVAVGIFCGNTFISNAGAGAGPGACYKARRLVGIEIKPDEAARARRNVATIDGKGLAEIVAADGIPWLKECKDTIDLLYLDADGAGGRGKSIYLDLLDVARHVLQKGSLVLAHNSVNSAKDLADYLAYVRNPSNCRESVNIILDDQGVEVTCI